jgi:hypothetical protein
MILLAVAVPAYNAEDCLAKHVDSPLTGTMAFIRARCALLSLLVNTQ